MRPRLDARRSDHARRLAFDRRRRAWPDDYWPPSPEPPSDVAWDEAIAAVGAGRERLKALLRDLPDPTATIPWGGAHTYLRTVLVALDHEAYHVGQIVLVRRLLGAWAG